MELSAISRRVFLLRAGAVAAASQVLVAATPPAMAREATPDSRAASVKADDAGSSGAALDGFVPKYIQAMNAPGLTLGYTDKHGAGKSSCYGFANLDKHEAVAPEMLFQIGSISKSFLAVVMLQLREEGKLDFDRPVLEYMPWLPIETPYGTVTLHHMLTHTTGLPGDGEVFPSNPTRKARQSWKPGERFHYSNFCFDSMGKLVSLIEGKPFGDCVQARILDPLGMTATSPRLTELIRARTAESYTPELRDRPFPRHGKLASAPKIDSDSSAGSIASTPDDMRKYMQMLLNRGQGPDGHGKRRILKEESFALMSHPHIKAEEFGPTASYGYGIAVDTLDGHTILRHTGGMVSFMSAMHLDIDGGYGAFASINAQLGYRPNPVAQYAIQCLRAHGESKPLPAEPSIPDPSIVKDAKQYEGTYHGADGKTCKVIAAEHSISLKLDDRDIPLEAAGGDRFLATLPEYSQFAFVFRREESKPDAVKPEAVNDPNAAPPAIVELTHGDRFFSRTGKPAAVANPERYAPYVGLYINDSPWLGSFRIVARKGQLMIEGEVPLIEMGEGVFRMGDEPDSPETLEFYHLAGGYARLVKMGGSDFWRTTVESM